MFFGRWSFPLFGTFLVRSAWLCFSTRNLLLFFRFNAGRTIIRNIFSEDAFICMSNSNTLKMEPVVTSFTTKSKKVIFNYMFFNSFFFFLTYSPDFGNQIDISYLMVSPTYVDPRQTGQMESSTSNEGSSISISILNWMVYCFWFNAKVGMIL